jgi:signal transduction histidine kinase
MSMVLEGDFGKVPAKLNEQLLKVYESNERLISLVSDLLNVSRIESGKMKFEMQTLDIEPIVASVVTEISTLAKAKKIYLKYQKPIEALPKLSIDPDKIRQVITNLVENSVKYTIAGGTQVTLEQANDQVRFCVSDTGLGISPADMPKIFEKYSRGSQLSTKAVGGTGLGLYVCRMIVEAHHGKIWAESNGEGKGARFYFTLPVAK